jgi:3',5'-cyclic-nucleotide phosphodiesterase
VPLRGAVRVAGYEVEAVPVSHTIECAGFVVRRGGVAIAYTGDTGPTEALWKLLNRTPDLRALLAEVSFPNEHAALATLSGHYIPETLATDLDKLERRRDVPTLLYHMKPMFQARIERECARIKGSPLHVLQIGDTFKFER